LGSRGFACLDGRKRLTCPDHLNLPLIVGVIAVIALALLGLVGYLIDRSADKHEPE